MIRYSSTVSILLLFLTCKTVGLEKTDENTKPVYVIKYRKGDSLIPVTVQMDFNQQGYYNLKALDANIWIKDLTQKPKEFHIRMVGYVWNLNPKAESKSITFYDYLQKVVAYKELSSNQCFISSIPNEDMMNETENLKRLKNGVINVTSFPTLMVTNKKVSQEDLKKFAGYRISRFCSGSVPSFVTSIGSTLPRVRMKRNTGTKAEDQDGQFSHRSYGHYGHQNHNYAQYGHETISSGKIPPGSQTYTGVGQYQVRKDVMPTTLSTVYRNGQETKPPERVPALHPPSDTQRSLEHPGSFQPSGIRQQSGSFPREFIPTGLGGYNLQTNQESGYHVSHPLGLKASSRYLGSVRSSGGLEPSTGKIYPDTPFGRSPENVLTNQHPLPSLQMSHIIPGITGQTIPVRDGHIFPGKSGQIAPGTTGQFILQTPGQATSKSADKIIPGIASQIIPQAADRTTPDSPSYSNGIKLPGQFTPIPGKLSHIFPTRTEFPKIQEPDPQLSEVSQQQSIFSSRGLFPQGVPPGYIPPEITRQEYPVKGFAIPSHKPTGVVQPSLFQPGYQTPAISQTHYPSSGAVQFGYEPSVITYPYRPSPDITQPGHRIPGIIKPDYSSPAAYLPGYTGRRTKQPDYLQPGIPVGKDIQPSHQTSDQTKQKTLSPDLYPSTLAHPGIQVSQPGQASGVFKGMIPSEVSFPGPFLPRMLQPGAITSDISGSRITPPGVSPENILYSKYGPMGPPLSGIPHPSVLPPDTSLSSVRHPGFLQSGASLPAILQPRFLPPGVSLPSIMHPGVIPPDVSLSGRPQLGVLTPGTSHSGMPYSSSVPSGTMLPGIEHPGVISPRISLPGMRQPDIVTPGTLIAGRLQPTTLPYVTSLPGRFQPDVSPPDSLLPSGISPPSIPLPGHLIPADYRIRHPRIPETLTPVSPELIHQGYEDLRSRDISGMRVIRPAGDSDAYLRTRGPIQTLVSTDRDAASSQTQIHTGYEGTAAEATSIGRYQGLGSQTQVQGGYTGNGSFSAQAQSGFSGGVTQSQVRGGRQGGISGSSAQVARVGSTQSQVQVGQPSGVASGSAQGSFSRGSTQVQTQSGRSGSSASAQSQSRGLSNSQATVNIDGNEAGRRNGYQGGVSASVSGGQSTGAAQTQLQGNYDSGRTYSANAQGGFDFAAEFNGLQPGVLPHHRIDSGVLDSGSVQLNRSSDFQTLGARPEDFPVRQIQMPSGSVLPVTAHIPSQSHTFFQPHLTSSEQTAGINIPGTTARVSSLGRRVSDDTQPDHLNIPYSVPGGFVTANGFPVLSQNGHDSTSRISTVRPSDIPSMQTGANVISRDHSIGTHYPSVPFADRYPFPTGDRLPAIFPSTRHQGVPTISQRHDDHGSMTYAKPYQEHYPSLQGRPSLHSQQGESIMQTKPYKGFNSVHAGGTEVLRRPGEPFGAQPDQRTYSGFPSGPIVLQQPGAQGTKVDQMFHPSFSGMSAVSQQPGGQGTRTDRVFYPSYPGMPEKTQTPGTIVTRPESYIPGYSETYYPGQIPKTAVKGIPYPPQQTIEAVPAAFPSLPSVFQQIPGIPASGQGIFPTRTDSRPPITYPAFTSQDAFPEQRYLTNETDHRYSTEIPHETIKTPKTLRDPVPIPGISGTLGSPTGVVTETSRLDPGHGTQPRPLIHPTHPPLPTNGRDSMTTPDCCKSSRDFRNRCCKSRRSKPDETGGSNVRCCKTKAPDGFLDPDDFDLDQDQDSSNGDKCRIVKAICYIVYKPGGRARICKPTATNDCR